MKLHTNINQSGDMQSARLLTFVLILFELRPFELFKDIHSDYWKALAISLQSARTITLEFILFESCPFELCK